MKFWLKDVSRGQLMLKRNGFFRVDSRTKLSQWCSKYSHSLSSLFWTDLRWPTITHTLSFPIVRRSLVNGTSTAWATFRSLLASANSDIMTCFTVGFHHLQARILKFIRRVIYSPIWGLGIFARFATLSLIDCTSGCSSGIWLGFLRVFVTDTACMRWLINDYFGGGSRPMTTSTGTCPRAILALAWLGLTWRLAWRDV